MKKFYECGPYKVLGGLDLLNPIAEKTYNGLCNHNMIFLEFDVLALDGLDPPDRFILYVDSILKLDFTGGSFPARNGNDLCGNPSFSETLTRVIAKI